MSMRNIAILLLVVTLSSTADAQTITLDTITKLSYCVGDPLTVSYNASGPFALDNHFKLQVSDANGSFASFTNIGNDSMLQGSFPITLNTLGGHYRVRVISTDPFIISSDNGSDIQVFGFPTPQVWPGNGTLAYVGTTDDTINIGDVGDQASNVSYLWVLGQDANPSTSAISSPRILYASAGTKSGTVTVTNPAGCSDTATFLIDVLTCRPQIPASARVVTGTESGTYPYVWVKAGGNYTVLGRSSPTVFAEAGSSVQGTFGIYYVKPGASLNDGSWRVCVYDRKTGASFFGGDSSFFCNDLEFDYSQVQAGVADNPPPSNVTILQSGNHLFANDEGLPIGIRITNILGSQMLSQHGNGSLDVDLSPLPGGVYFAVIQAGNDREVKRIAVVH